MALQKSYTMTNGLVAPDAYTVIMLSQRNKVLNRIEAEIHVYANEQHRWNVSESNPPLHRFLHLIEDNVRPRVDTSIGFTVQGQGAINIVNGEVTLQELVVTEETTLEDIVQEINDAELDITAQLTGDMIILDVGETLQGGAGAGLGVTGENITIAHLVIGEDAVPSQLEELEPDALKVANMSLEQAIYNDIKVKRPEYADAIDV